MIIINDVAQQNYSFALYAIQGHSWIVGKQISQLYIYYTYALEALRSLTNCLQVLWTLNSVNKLDLLTPQDLYYSRSRWYSTMTRKVQEWGHYLLVMEWNYLPSQPDIEIGKSCELFSRFFCQITVCIFLGIKFLYRAMHRFLSLNHNSGVRNKCRAMFILFWIFFLFSSKSASMNYKRGTLILVDTLIPDSGVDKARFSLKSICF